MKRSKLLVFGMVFAFIAAFLGQPVSHTAAKAGDKQIVTISAAASLKDALIEVQRNFEKQNSDIKLMFNFGGSGSLEKQIEAGAPVDLFLSADTGNVKKLDVKNLVDKSSIRDFAKNQLVLVSYIGKTSKVKKIEDLAKPEIKYISLGTIGSVPAGDYAKEALTYYGLWDKINNKIVYAKDVTAVLNYVRLGNADEGFVYLTDAKKKSDAIISMILPEASHSPIVYRGAVISASKYKAASSKFMSYLGSTRARTIFEKYGFSIPTN